MKKKTKSKLSKKYVTDGELLKDVRDQLIVELPKLTRRRLFWGLFPYIVIVFAGLLLFVDFSRPGKTGDCLAREGAEITIVKLPEPDWRVHGLAAAADHWIIPNPAGRSAPIFDISLAAQTLEYKRTIVRALSQDLAGEARLDLLEPPLIVKCPTVIILRPTELDRNDKKVREAVIRTCALKIDGKYFPLHKFIDPHTHSGKLVIEITPSYGRPRFEENLSAAFGRLVKVINKAFVTKTAADG